MNILYAEDESAISEVVTEILKDEGHTVTLVTDGAAAYELLQDKTKHFDLLLTDHMMPRMKGCDLVSKVIEEGNLIPVIVTSGSLQIEKEFTVVSELLTHVNLIPKPFDMDRLIDKIKELEK